MSCITRIRTILKPQCMRICAVKGVHIDALDISSDGDKISLKWSDGRRSEYSSVWLRDNCPSTTHPTSLGRLLLMASLDPDIKVAGARQMMDTQSLEVDWPDNKTSSFSFDWLRSREWRGTQPQSNIETKSLWGGEHTIQRH